MFYITKDSYLFWQVSAFLQEKGAAVNASHVLLVLLNPPSAPLTQCSICYLLDKHSCHSANEPHHLLKTTRVPVARAQAPIASYAYGLQARHAIFLPHEKDCVTDPKGV